MTKIIPITEILDDVERFIRRYVILPDDHAGTTATLWVVHTHAIDAAHATPYLVVASPEKGSGKTRLLEVLELLIAIPWRVSNVTTAVIYRRIDRDRPTLLLDEADTIFTRSGEMNEALRGILNAGNRPGGKVTRCTGDAHEPKDFPVYGPKVLAMSTTAACPTRSPTAR